MSITWKYKIDLKDKAVFEKIEKNRGIIIPDDLKMLIEQANAATPSLYKYMLGSTEKTLGAILSFNKDDEDVDLVYTALNDIDEKNYFPFGIDAFGDYICLDLTDDTVTLWSHEENKFYRTNKTLKEFLDSLY